VYDGFEDQIEDIFAVGYFFVLVVEVIYEFQNLVFDGSIDVFDI